MTNNNLQPTHLRRAAEAGITERLLSVLSRPSSYVFGTSAIQRKRTFRFNMVSFFGEIAIWIIAGILMAIFTMFDVETAYGIAIVILFVIAIHALLKYKPKDYACSKCEQRFSLNELKAEYNQSLNSTPKSGAN
jgi:hypothetical protein